MYDAEGTVKQIHKWIILEFNLVDAQNCHLILHHFLTHIFTNQKNDLRKIYQTQKKTVTVSKINFTVLNKNIYFTCCQQIVEQKLYSSDFCKILYGIPVTDT